MGRTKSARPRRRLDTTLEINREGSFLGDNDGVVDLTDGGEEKKEESETCAPETTTTAAAACSDWAKTVKSTPPSKKRKKKSVRNNIIVDDSSDENDDDDNNNDEDQQKREKVAEVRIIDMGNDESGSETIIHVCPKEPRHLEEGRAENGTVLLRRYCVKACHLVVGGEHHNQARFEQNGVSKSNRRSAHLYISTKDGAHTILKQCCKDTTGNEVLSEEDVSHIAFAVSHAILIISLEEDTIGGEVTVSVFLTSLAFSLCSPTGIGARGGGTANYSGKKGRLGRNKTEQPSPLTLLLALGAIFPENELLKSVASNPSPQRRSNDIAAKLVYKQVDNAHAHEFESYHNIVGGQNSISSANSGEEQLRLEHQDESSCVTNAAHNTSDTSNEVRKPLHISGLVPSLRPYQDAAVRWMLKRESTGRGKEGYDDCWELAWVVIGSGPGVVPLYDYSEGQQEESCIFYCPFAGWLARTREEAMTWTLASGGGDGHTKVAGGILAESMGLGKTVEVLACVLANPLVKDSGTPKAHAANRVDSNGEQINPDEQSLSPAAAADRKQYLEPTEEGHKLNGEETPKQDGCASVLNPLMKENETSKAQAGKCFDSNEEQINRKEQSFSPAAAADREQSLDSAQKEYKWDGKETLKQNGSASVLPSKIPKLAGSRSKSAARREYVEDEPVVCMCGATNRLPGMLSWIYCSNCKGPMHGACAGFENEEQLLSESSYDPITNRRFCAEEHCPFCVAGQENKIRSRATLIIAPVPIVYQWEREIRRHTSIPTVAKEENGTAISRPLKVIVYPGVREICDKKHTLRRKLDMSSHKMGSKPTKQELLRLLNPRVLADADIVLMSFQALSEDLGHSAENPYVSSSDATGPSRKRRDLRKRKRYRVVPTPLASIHWWRVCLDEAQRVETPTAASARMALQLATQHRWCISGTPIGRGKLDDLYGLFLFLRLSPFCDSHWFKSCLHQSHMGVEERIRHLLKEVFWRSTKMCASVRSQMGIPEQEEKKVYLRFSSVEKHFYDIQLEETLLAANVVIENKHEGSWKSAKEIDALSSRLQQLRAACCHPQVGSSAISKLKKKGHSSHRHAYDQSSVSSGVLSMDQILDRLTDDAKTKCEEAQRLVMLHSNALACLYKLKVDAKKLGYTFDNGASDIALLRRSCKEYFDALDLSDTNATPTAIVGEAIVTGNVGFRHPRKVIRHGVGTLEWLSRVHEDDTVTTNEQQFDRMWARIDFEGPSKKLREVKISPVLAVPGEVQSGYGSSVVLLQPKECVLQVSNSAAGGEFVDVVSCEIPCIDNTTDDTVGSWQTLGGFRTNKAKSWRILVKSFHEPTMSAVSGTSEKRYIERSYYVGLKVELLEPNIAIDSLQRLHVLCNASSSMDDLLRQQQEETCDDLSSSSATSSLFSDTEKMKKRLGDLREESLRIESLYMDGARLIHKQCQLHLSEITKKRQGIEAELESLKRPTKGRVNDSYDLLADCWWDDYLSFARLYVSDVNRRAICETIRTELELLADSPNRPSDMARFPGFGDVDGLQMALRLRLETLADQSKNTSHSGCIRTISSLSSNPSQAEILENTQCRVCRADWFQTGPICRHCKLEKSLISHKKRIMDPIVFVILKELHRWAKLKRVSWNVSSEHDLITVEQRAVKFFELHEICEREVTIAWRAWTSHVDLISDIDELNSCKQTMRLAHEGEDLSSLNEHEEKLVVAPLDIGALSMDHAAKQAMSLGNLRRCMNTLRFLKNQYAERKNETAQRENEQKDCILCLSPFEGERAVLACGHCFHYSPCVEKLLGRGGGVIVCPLRCTQKTRKEDVLIASEKQKDDGSKGTRVIEGCWGTKVDRLIGDVMDVSEMGEKSIIFSQWDDMLSILEQALIANNVSFVRPKTGKSIGQSTKQFRSSECSVLLLNVKNGAEGLTLVEATHIFMMEPLLDCGLDIQAVNRIHRIGQTCKTYVHRYIIEDTIEVKIDRLRMERQENHLEDDIPVQRKKTGISGGGIDGGFSKSELQELLK